MHYAGCRQFKRATSLRHIGRIIKVHLDTLCSLLFTQNSSVNSGISVLVTRSVVREIHSKDMVRTLLCFVSLSVTLHDALYKNPVTYASVNLKNVLC